MTAPLLGLAGFGQSGKDFFADILVRNHGWRRLAFADRLKAALYDIDPYLEGGGPGLSDWVDTVGWDFAKGDYEVRALLQRLGVAVRTHVSEQAWVLPVMAETAELRRLGIPVVITDVRFDNEVEAVRYAGGQVALKRRPGIGPVNGHASEHLAGRPARFFDRTIETPTIEGLADVAKMVDMELRR